MSLRAYKRQAYLPIMWSIPHNWDVKCDNTHILTPCLQSNVPELQIAASGNQTDIELIIVRI